MRRPVIMRAASLARIAKGAAITLGGVIAAAAFAALIFWDADFYAARDRWEHFKLAWFGEWTPGRKGADGAAAQAFRDRLAGITGLTFFHTAPVVEAGFDIVTGFRFATAADAAAGTPSARWCYAILGDGAVTRRVDLASRSGESAPDYADLSTIGAELWADLGMGADDLAALARAHCRVEAAFPAPFVKED